MNKPLDEYRESRNELLSKIVRTLSTDERFVAAWLTGSFSRNDADAVSDLDLNLVVSDSYSESLCRRVGWMSSKTTEERLDLFSRFGMPVVIHENNHNAPEGGTFTFTLYGKSHLMVDWILIPENKAYRPVQAYLLFEKIKIPTLASIPSEDYESRITRASERVAFFWMMMAVTAKYLVRNDSVFVIRWLEELSGILLEVNCRIAGKPWEYVRGSRTVLEPTIRDQRQALYKLGEKMESLLPELVKMGAQVLPSPMTEIKAILELANDE